MHEDTPTEEYDDESNHLFTPHEVSRLLPDIKIKFKEIMERKKFADMIKKDVEHFSLLGFDVPEAIEKAQELDEVVKDLMTRVDELEDLGLKVRDLEMGLVDFPAMRFGKVVYLCWRYGENEVGYWHAESDGFGGRKPLNIQIASP